MPACRLSECTEQLMKPVRVVDRQIWRESGLSSGRRSIPEETAVALTYDGGTYAVMMATPQDLQDFAVGFSLNEGVINSAVDIESFDMVPLDDGIELRMWLSKPKADRLQDRRRHIAGPTGCGLCGIDSIAEAMRPAALIEQGQQFSSEQIMVALREDVGRHNALDKLSGALARASVVASEGIILLTSRVSVEMVQKSAAIGAPVMVSVSAPTALAVAWRMQRISHLPPLRARTDSKCSRIPTAFHLEPLPMSPIGEGSTHGT